LAFLKQLSLEHGYDFTIRGSILVFYSRVALEAQPAIRTLTRGDLESFEFRNRTHDIYSSSQLVYWDSVAKSVIVQGVAAAIPIAPGDTLKTVARCENGQQALLKAQAALNLHNMLLVDASLVMPGSIAMAAGSVVDLLGFGEFDGTYLILTARHRVDRAHGYATSVEVSRVLR
jgi:hypothetical protein